MKTGLLLLTIFIAFALLFLYTLIERRINQRACVECGFRVSVDQPEELCPRCGLAIV
jgi:hypothetical protein